MEAPGRRHRGCTKEMELLWKTNKRNRDLHGSGRDQRIRSNLAGCRVKGELCGAGMVAGQKSSSLPSWRISLRTCSTSELFEDI